MSWPLLMLVPLPAYLKLLDDDISVDDLSDDNSSISEGGGRNLIFLESIWTISSLQ
jgi:hypothetical protein